MTLNAGLFVPTNYEATKKSTEILSNLKVEDTVSKASKAVNTYRSNFVKILETAVEQGTIDDDMSKLLTDAGINYYPILKSDSNKQIIRWNPAMEGPIKLLEKTLSTFMGDPSGEGAFSFGIAAGQGTGGPFSEDNVYTKEDHNRLRSADTDLASIRKKQIAAFRVYNNIFWGGTETRSEVAEQTGWGGLLPDTADVEKGGLAVISAARDYYNEMFIQKHISNWELGKNGGVPEVKVVLGNVLSQMEAERKGIKSGLGKYKNYALMKNGPEQRINDIYHDMLNLAPENTKWKAILKDMYNIKRHFSEKEDADNMYHPKHWETINDNQPLEDGLKEEVVDHISESPYGDKLEDWLDWYKDSETTDEDRLAELERIRDDKLPYFLKSK
jgi:hypothetical protein